MKKAAILQAMLRCLFMSFFFFYHKSYAEMMEGSEWLYSASRPLCITSMLSETKSVGKHGGVEIWFSVAAVTMKGSAVPKCPWPTDLLTCQSLVPAIHRPFIEWISANIALFNCENKRLLVGLHHYEITTRPCKVWAKKWRKMCECREMFCVSTEEY